MKKQLLFSFIIMMAFLFKPEFGQAQNKNAFYVEGLGNGLLFSFNYDTRFSADSPWGARVGFGYIGDVGGGGGIITVPVMVNHLLGKDGKYFEVGGGIVYVAGDADIGGGFDSLAGTFSFQYRRQPVEGGFMWKAGFTPILAEGVFIPWYPGLSIGYTW